MDFLADFSNYVFDHIYRGKFEWQIGKDVNVNDRGLFKTA